MQQREYDVTMYNTACMQGEHGSLAVRTEGSGALRGVRVINLIRGTLFWFKVDSAVPIAVPVKQEPALVSQPINLKQEVRVTFYRPPGS